MVKGLGLGAPTVEVAQEVGERRACTGRDLVGLHRLASGLHHRHAADPGDMQQLLDGGVADPPLGHIDDALEGQVVVGRLDQPQIGVDVADFRPLEEAWPADHRVGDLQHHEAFFEGPHLERGADQDGHVAELARLLLRAALLGALDLLGDQPALGLAVPDAANNDLFAVVALGPEGLAEPALVGFDQAGGGGQDVAGGAVVALQPDHCRAGEVALEAQDVVHLGAAPAIDRLVVVADAADVLALLGQQTQPQILRDVGVLILVDQHVFEPLVEVGQHVRIVHEDRQVVQQQVAEIAGVQHPQAFLIEPVERLALAARELGPLGRRQAVGRPATVFPMVDQAGHRLGRPALGVDVLGLQNLLDQPFLVVGVEDGEVRLQPNQFGVAAQDLGGDRVEGAKPAQALGGRADDVGDPLAHLARGLVGEGDDQQFPRLGSAGGQDVRQSRGQNAGLAGARARQHQHRPLGRLDRRALLGVQALEIVGTAHAREVADAGGGEGVVERFRH